MKYYIDITLVANEEDNLAFVWSEVYIQMHLALVETRDQGNEVNIAFSFPLYGNHDFPLGDVLRVFADSKERLVAIDTFKWLNRLDGYVHVSPIKEIPTDIKGYATFSRKQFKSNPARLARRYAKRHNVTLEEALKVYEGVEGKETKLPYINIRSSSTGQYLKIFIERKKVKQEEIGRFNTFGLSKTSTVPIF